VTEQADKEAMCPVVNDALASTCFWLCDIWKRSDCKYNAWAVAAAMIVVHHVYFLGFKIVSTTW
jgi:hypothetical protein